MEGKSVSSVEYHPWNTRIAIGCWNFRSVKEEATQALFVHEMEKYSNAFLRPESLVLASQ